MIGATVAMQRFFTSTDIPSDCVVAPTSFSVPRPGAECIGIYEGMELFKREDVSELMSRNGWLKRGRKVRQRQEPAATVWLPHSVEVFGDWQTAEVSAAVEAEREAPA